MAISDTLEAPKVRLEPFEPARHLHERYVGWLNDQEVVRYSQQRLRRHSIETCRAYAETFVDSPNYFWAIVAKHTRDSPGSAVHVGTMTAHVQPADGVGDLGILVGEKAVWGQGFATAAFALACDYLLRTLALRKVTAGTLSVNAPMLRLMEKVGMVSDGRRNAQLIWEGRPVDVVYAAIFRNTWLASQSGALT